MSKDDWMIASFQSVEVLLKVAIHPSESTNPLPAAHKQLQKLLFKFEDSLEGIPISYSQLNFPRGKEYARILGENPWIHVDFLTEITMFKPRIGQHICGKVIKVADNFLSILVFAMFNASISGASMGKNYKYNPTINKWQSKQGNLPDLGEGDKIVFLISSFEHSNGVINIEGCL